MEMTALGRIESVASFLGLRPKSAIKRHLQEISLRPLLMRRSHVRIVLGRLIPPKSLYFTMLLPLFVDLLLPDKWSY